MRLGVHLTMAKGLQGALTEARRLGIGCAQIFSGNPRAWKQRPLDPAEAAEFVAGCRAQDLAPVVIHSPYLINLAAPEDDPWRRSIAALADQLDRARTLGARAVVVHPGSRKDRALEWGLDRVAAGAARALDQAGEGAALWLENTAGGGGAVGGTLSQLRALAERLSGYPVGFCLDTAHALAAGYGLDRPQGVKSFLDRVEAWLGLDRVGLWHCNDSVFRRLSHRDQHTHLGRGYLGGEGFRALLADPRLAGANLVLETPKESPWSDPRNLAYLRRLLRDLPGAANVDRQGVLC